MKKAFKEICYGPVRPPRQHWPMEPVSLTDETMELRKEKVLTAMKHQGLEVLCIYADREHGGNFGYLTGFEPRFEEAVLVLHQDGTAFLLLGNESLRMGSYCRLPNTVIHVPHFSLPNQPMETAYSLKELFAQANLSPGIITGIVGWKLFTSTHDCNRQLYEIPSFLVDCIQEITGSKAACNAGELFLHPDTGVRVTNTANEIAHFEYGASLASDCVLRAMDEIAVGKIYQCRGSPPQEGNLSGRSLFLNHGPSRRPDLQGRICRRQKGGSAGEGGRLHGKAGNSLFCGSCQLV